MTNWKFILLVYFSILNSVLSARCDRRPYGSITQPSPSDGRFQLMVVGAQSYVPEQNYVVRLTRTDDESLFTEFMITAEGEQRRNPQTKRMMVMDAGALYPKSEETRYTTNRASCHNTVQELSSTEKESVEALWTAPKSGSGCVTIRAMVAINDVVWFESGVPLTQYICEDLSQPDDIAPVINMECSVCEDAKYEISFTGHWGRNTHPLYYPENDEITAFSKLVGASHSIDWSPWFAGGMASEGLKELAENANGTKLEQEIFEKLSSGEVRTLIKGRGHRGYGRMDLPTYSYFRTDKSRHLVTVVVALSPSPDWFLGVSRFDLCTAENKWLDERELKLYPWDAGTDNGVSYESENFPTYPPDAIERVKMNSNDRKSPFYEIEMTDMHPFGMLHLKLIRTYDRGGCEEQTEEGETPAPEEETTSGSEEGSEPEEPSSEGPLAVDPDASEDCPVSQWTDWTLCECSDIYRNRKRYYMVDGEPVGKYDREHPDDGKEFDVPASCDDVEMLQVEECPENEACQGVQEEPTSNRRVMGPLAPGQGWAPKKRNAKQKKLATLLKGEENYNGID